MFMGVEEVKFGYFISYSHSLSCCQVPIPKQDLSDQFPLELGAEFNTSHHQQSRPADQGHISQL
jgi:hypothetical protein